MDGRGVPAAVICTDEFVPSARAQAAICGIPDYRFAVIPHPIGSLRHDELDARAEQALEQIVGILTGRE
ncbi:MAG TPA: hypothetical protein VFJ24_01395 [Gaiellales bacterium]|nr:hypothetical protein [Gaiellales bacterium]